MQGQAFVQREAKFRSSDVGLQILGLCWELQTNIWRPLSILARADGSCSPVTSGRPSGPSLPEEEMKARVWVQRTNIQIHNSRTEEKVQFLKEQFQPVL